MSTIQTALQIYDGVSGPLRSISNAMNIVINTFESMQDASSKGIDTASLQAAREQLVMASVAAEEMGDNLKKAEQGQKQFNDQIQQGESAAMGLGGKIKQIVGAYIGIQGIKMAVGFVTDTISLQNVQNEAETKLGTIMRQRMGADPTVIQSVKDLASAQQELGVVGDEVQLSGAQQLATFLNSTDALNNLIPAMNNLAVQQNGVNVSTGDMVNIGNMMGKVMQGQVGALTRVGVTFTEAQEKVLKYGNEQERAATLAQVITDNVGNMNAVMASTPQGKIQQLANTWGDIKEAVGAELYPAVMQFFDTIGRNMPQAQGLVMGLAGGLKIVISVISRLIDGAAAVVGFFQNNWTIIGPIIWGIAAALGAYIAYLIIINGIELISNGIKIAACIASYAHAAATKTEADKTAVATAKQYKFNTALLACPITWIIVGIIAIIAAIYAIVAAVNKLTGSTYSATGIIMGVISVAVAFVCNLLFGLLETAFSVINTMINPFINFANFLANVFVDPVGAVIHLFGDMADGVLAILEKIASAIDIVFGSNLADTVSGWRGTLDAKVEEAAGKYGNGKYQKVMENLDLSVEGLGVERFEYGSAWDKGYKFGQKIDDKVSGIFDGFAGGFGLGDEWDKINQSSSETAANTAKMSDSMDLANEELKYMRDIAEQEIINRFTTAEIKVDMINNNNINSGMDLDGIVDGMAGMLGNTLQQVAEGVHE